MKESSRRGMYKGNTPARKRATKKYLSETVDRIGLLLPRGKKQIIKDHAAAAGESMNAYINGAIDARMRQQDADKTAPQENTPRSSSKAASAQNGPARQQDSSSNTAADLKHQKDK